MFTESAGDAQRHARASAFDQSGCAPEGAPEYRPTLTRGLWVLNYFPSVAKLRARMASALGEQLDGSVDAADLMPPGATQPARSPAYPFTQQAHSYPKPGPIEPAFGPRADTPRTRVGRRRAIGTLRTGDDHSGSKTCTAMN